MPPCWRWPLPTRPARRWTALRWWWSRASATSRGWRPATWPAPAAAGAFRRLGAEVVELSSPWRLGRAQSELAVAWLDGWTAAAHEQVPELDPGARYAAHRRDQALSRRLTAEIGHADLLVIP